MENARYFREKLAGRRPCLGTCVTFSDPTVVDALSGVLDFVWIDTEHNPTTLESVQSHILATKGTRCAPLVRVPWNDPVLIKPVLDIGAAGVIVPLVRTADDVRKAVAACKYPPEGIRGYGPRRPTKYGQQAGPEYIRTANESIIIAVQIEHSDAVNNIEEILEVPGLTTIVIGPNDLSGSYGHLGETSHPVVVEAIETVIDKANAMRVPVGMAMAGKPETLIGWLKRGVQWMALGADFYFLMQAARKLTDEINAEPWGEGTNA